MASASKRVATKDLGSTVAEQSVAFEQNTFIRSLESLIVEESSDEEGRPPALWEVGWHKMWMMTGFILGAILFVLGYHFFCTFVNGTVVGRSSVHFSNHSITISQSAINYVVTQAAYIVRSLLMASIICSYEQRIWHEVRMRAYSIDTISMAFGMIHSPIAVFNRDILGRLTIPFLITLITWLLPLSSIFAPGCLSVQNVVQNNINDVPVPSLDWGQDLGLFFTVQPQGQGGQNDLTIGTWNGISDRLLRTVYTVAFGGEIKTWSSPCGSNCSYALPLEGVSSKCWTENVARPAILQHHTYLGRTNVIDQRVNPSTTFEAWFSSSPDSPEMKYTTCHFFEGVYMLNVSYQLNFPSVNVMSFTARRLFNYNPNSLNSTKIKSLNQNDWKSVNQATLLSTIDYVLSGSLNTFSESESQTLGNAKRDSKSSETHDTMIAQTALLDSDVDFANGLEQLLQNITISLISWNTESKVVPVTIESVAPTYSYTSWRLILPFTIAVSAAIACAAIGMRALLSNGVPSEISFRQIVATTRNSSIDKVAIGACLGGRLLPSGFRRTRIKYGAMREPGSGRRHAGFGLVREVEPLDPIKHYW
ncbi:hypothetical protein NEOLI_001001 [Neolecta irregularis DAH-3]|uniref:Uncharacterized protein n=1 Tax=Neolecta irregularis (strain DAH-3) TaxID=1198029 RepID=A0A1U7LW20_NEOID|nr:hypothetical protein NEOLI_001001 [Neolecta irregularis DAH-3]|eukprot:OLL26818.1 hypothetical protein NEOLI_001001 [Neolecta irregularis DAH-3]